MSTIVVEAIEREDESRLSAFPLKYPSVYALWKEQRELRWETSEIDSHLEKDWVEINSGLVDAKVLRAVKFMLAFFAVSDGLVIDIIQEKLSERIKSREHKMVYAAITEAENIHNVTYSKLIEAYEPKIADRNKLFDAVANYPSVRRLVNMLRNWAEKPIDGAPVTMLEKEMLMEGPIDANGRRTYVKNTYTEVAPSLAQLLMGNMIMEGTCFPSEFTKIYYIYDYLHILGGLYKANEFISRDENTHVKFGVYNYANHIEHKLDVTVVHAMMREAADVMSEFISDSIPEPMVIMNAPHLIQYVRFVQDNLCTVLGYNKLWNVSNPFMFMEKQSYGVRISDFFVDKSISEYGQTRAGLDAADSAMNFSEDF